MNQQVCPGTEQPTVRVFVFACVGTCLRGVCVHMKGHVGECHSKTGNLSMP